MPLINSSPTKTVSETTEDNDDLKETKEIEKPGQIEEEKKAGRLANFLADLEKETSSGKRTSIERRKTRRE